MTTPYLFSLSGHRALAAMLAVSAATVLLDIQSGLAQQTGPVAAGDPEFFVVQGLAIDDELNLRATASATGMLVGRLPNGALVRNLGCGDVGSVVWCKVADPNAKGLEGWAAGRYLIGEASAPPPAAAGAEQEAAGTRGDGVAPEVAALLPQEDPETRIDASADIPCAREFGQPMRLCAAQVRRGDTAGSAEVTVMWPDGGMRIITFKAGKAETSDSADGLHATREADLNMIRVGKGERFEITDAFAFGG